MHDMLRKLSVPYETESLPHMCFTKGVKIRYTLYAHHKLMAENSAVLKARQIGTLTAQNCAVLAYV